MNNALYEAQKVCDNFLQQTGIQLSAKELYEDRQNALMSGSNPCFFRHKLHNGYLDYDIVSANRNQAEILLIEPEASSLDDARSVTLSIGELHSLSSLAQTAYEKLTGNAKENKAMSEQEFPTLSALGIRVYEIEKAGESCRNALDEAGFSTQDKQVLNSDAFDMLIEKIKESSKTTFDIESYDLTSFITQSMYEQCAEFLKEQGLTAEIRDGAIHIIENKQETEKVAEHKEKAEVERS